MTILAGVADRFLQLTGHAPEGMWQAPGRVNLIGEHTDYNAGLALPFAIDRRTLLAARRRDDGHVRCWTAQGQREAAADLDRLEASSVDEWARYPLGVLWALQRDGLDIPGVDLLIDSTVPLGSGLSSSAALEAAVAVALDDLCGAHLDRRRLVELCHQAESEFVGAPVGMLDQFAVLFGEPGHALLIDFRSLAIQSVPLGIGPIVVVDTGVRHRHAVGEYASRRQACEQAAKALGVTYLREATAEDVAARLTGELQRRARHVVTENDRVTQTAARLRDGLEIGDLLYASHASLRDDYQVSCPELDAVVDTARDHAASGARMTGGGFGGCAIVLGIERPQLEEAVQRRFRQAKYACPNAFTVVASPSAGRLA